MTYQLDLFETYQEEDLLKKDIDAIKKEMGNVRRGLFARHNELSKMFLTQQQELEALKQIILAQQEEINALKQMLLRVA